MNCTKKISFSLSYQREKRTKKHHRKVPLIPSRVSAASKRFRCFICLLSFQLDYGIKENTNEKDLFVFSRIPLIFNGIVMNCWGLKGSDVTDVKELREFMKPLKMHVDNTFI